nr:hypothetical protein [Clostridium sp. 12(A)]
MNHNDIPLNEIRDWFKYGKKYKWIEEHYSITREQIEECIRRFVEETMGS